MGQHSRISSFQWLARNGAADPNRSLGMLSTWLLPKDSPLINMDAHLASSSPAPYTRPTLCLVSPWSEIGEGGRETTGVLVIYRNKALHPAWPEYYMRPSVPALLPLPNPCEGRTGACLASSIPSALQLKGTTLQTPSPLLCPPTKTPTLCKSSAQGVSPT